MKARVILFIICVFQFNLTAQNCDRKFVGLPPLIDMGKSLYKGYEGGLYPNGQNDIPPVHLQAGLALAQSIVPLNSMGNPDPNGRTVLLSIGMSNATQEFSVFKAMADTLKIRNPRLTIVDGAQGGQTAAVIVDTGANFWRVIDQRLTNQGVTRQQVQIAWIKEANANPRDSFPTHAQVLSTQLQQIARILKTKYPNIKLAYFSSRIYGGYATTTLNPEPFAYESGYSVKWAIAEQINGNVALAFEGTNAVAPWMAWGPYFWADGELGRSDSVKWFCTELSSDGTHPSMSGRQKAAKMLLDFFMKDKTTIPWFLAMGPVSVEQENPSELQLYQNYPNPFYSSTTIRFSLRESSNVTLRIFDQLGKRVHQKRLGFYRPGVHEISFDARGLPSGIYRYEIDFGVEVRSRLMQITR